MSLIGIRDLSVIETPPKERQPIQTFVTSQNNMVIKEAVMNEVSRGGQVFYVYNKVESIDEKYLELKKTFTRCKYCLCSWKNDTT